MTITELKTQENLLSLRVPDGEGIWAFMTRGRYIELSKQGAGLTEEERKAGWHFCASWKGMLIHKEDPTYQECKCGYKNSKTTESQI